MSIFGQMQVKCFFAEEFCCLVLGKHVMLIITVPPSTTKGTFISFRITQAKASCFRAVRLHDPISVSCVCNNICTMRKWISSSSPCSLKTRLILSYKTMHRQQVLYCCSFYMLHDVETFLCVAAFCSEKCGPCTCNMGRW